MLTSLLKRQGLISLADSTSALSAIVCFMDMHQMNEPIEAIKEISDTIKDEIIHPVVDEIEDLATDITGTILDIFGW